MDNKVRATECLAAVVQPAHLGATVLPYAPQNEGINSVITRKNRTNVLPFYVQYMQR